MLSAFLQKLLFVKQFSIDKGKIQILGEKQIMLDASALLVLQEIDETKIYTLGKDASMKNLREIVQHAKVYKKVKDVFLAEIAELGKKVGESDAGVITMLEQIFNIFGLGAMTIRNLDNASPSALIHVQDSTLAEEWISYYKKQADSAVCTLTAGVLAGMFSYIFRQNVDCAEMSCKACGQEQCLFKIS